jgi:hypothetical protein
MTTHLKTLSALAIVAATLTVTSIAASNAASARAFRREPGHGPVIRGQPFRVSPNLQRYGSRLNITCLACNLPRPPPFHPHPLPRRDGRWNYGWQNRPEAVVAGAPAAVVAVPAQAVPAVTPPAVGQCSCLTKQNLADGGVLFQDICTNENAIASPVDAGPR